MRVITSEKRIQKLKLKFPNLIIIRIKENVWEIGKSKLTEQEESEIDFFF